MNKLSIIFIIICLIFFNVPEALANTWSPPTQAPPGGNTAEPLDVSSRTQSKGGMLTVDVLGVNILDPQSALEVWGNIEVEDSTVPVWYRNNHPNTNNLLIRDQNPVLNIEHFTGNPGGSTLRFGHAQGDDNPKPLAEISSVLFDGGYLTKAGHLKFKTSYSGSLYDRMIITNAGKIGVGTNDPQQELEVRDDTTGVARLRITDVGINENPELQLQYNTGVNDHWGIYVAKTDSNKLKIWVNGNNRLTIATDGKVGILNESPGKELDVTGQINASGGLCIAGDCKTSWSAVGGGGNPTQIKETTIGADFDGKHNADFSSPGANGWQGIKSFALANGCDATWHVCQGWELSYIYTQGISTANCTTHTDYPGDMTTDPGDNCLGWVIGQVTESTIETETGFMEAGDCYGYKSAVTDIYHSAVWYIDQWGAATCSSELPVLCCK